MTVALIDHTIHAYQRLIKLYHTVRYPSTSSTIITSSDSAPGTEVSVTITSSTSTDLADNI